MQILLKENHQKSTRSRDDISKEKDTGIGSDDQKNIDNIYSESQNDNFHPSQIPDTQHSKPKQIRAQTSKIYESNNANNTLLANKKQYMESIRLSYMVLSSPIESSPEKKMKKLVKKSFVAIQEEEENQVGDEKIKQLKTPLKIDLKKLESKNKYSELSEDLQIFNGKHWSKCHFDIDIKAQQLLVSNLHIPFSTIEKIKIFKPDESRKMRQIKVTYQKVSEEGTLFLNLKEDKCLKKVPVNYLIFQQILTSKLTFQNKFKETKWEKRQHICQEVVFGSYIFGQIYKKSQYFGKWEKRYIVLNGQGIFSYKSAGKKEDYSFFVQRQSIEYMWSRFDLVDNHLIVKIKHGLKQTEFGIPIANYGTLHYKNWLYYFYKLMT